MVSHMSVSVVELECGECATQGATMYNFEDALGIQDISPGASHPKIQFLLCKVRLLSSVVCVII